MKTNPTISLKALFAATTIAAFLVPVFAFPSGWYVFLPALLILILAAALYSEVRTFRRRKTKFKIGTEWRLISVSLGLLVSLSVFGSLFDIAYGKYRDASLTSRQFNRIAGLRDPAQFRAIALRLHSELLKLPPTERWIRGDSPLVPPEIRSVHPINILANENYLVLKMTPEGDSQVVIYPTESTFGRVSSHKISEDFFYYGRQR